MKEETGLAFFYELVREADVIVQNYRAGVAEKLHVDYESVRQINPAIIYAAGSGFGQDSPLARRPCYDIVAQSMGAWLI